LAACALLLLLAAAGPLGGSVLLKLVRRFAVQLSERGSFKNEEQIKRPTKKSKEALRRMSECTSCFPANKQEECVI
jgi:recombinational DNA repair protein RecR